MASFTALNVEPSADVEVEVDNSKEIQVEEALKLYQNALRLHAQGPAYYEEAEDAYDTLFASEIFSYPESQSEAKRLAKLKDIDEVEIEIHDESDAVLPLAGAESAPNTLPQLLYLSYKNHGQFLVDRIAHHVTLERQGNPDFIFERDKDAREAAQESLDFFVEALDKDESDADLWRRTARVSRLLGSRRILRFCLEAALQRGDLAEAFPGDDGGLESAFAKTDLSDLLDETQDELSLEQLRDVLYSKKKLSKWLTQIKDPFPKLPKPSTDELPKNGPPPKVTNIQASERSWQSLGKAILARKKLEDRDKAKLKKSGYQISIPLKRQASMEEIDLKSPLKLVTADSLAKKPEDGDASVANPGAEDEREADPAVLKESTELSDSKDADPSAPTEQTEQANGSMQVDEEAIVMSPAEEKSGDQHQRTPSLSEKRPSLKRNSESAGLNDGPDGGRARSKRLRARAETSVAVEEEANPKELSKNVENQLEGYFQADKWVFRVLEAMLEKIEVQNPHSLDALRQLFPRELLHKEVETEPLPTVLSDFKDVLLSWNSNSSNLLLHGRGSGASVTLIGTADDSGLASFLEHSKPTSKNAGIDILVLFDEGLSELADIMNGEHNDIDNIALYWLMGLLSPQQLTDSERASRYQAFVWPATLKEAVLQMIVEEDSNITNLIQILVDEGESLEVTEGQSVNGENRLTVMQLTQTLFELHLDVYGQMTSASSTVDQPTRTLQKDRTQRWASLTARALRSYVDLDSPNEVVRHLALRHVWSTVMYISLTEPSSREHVLLCLRDLRQTLERQASPILVLPNSGIMPEISVEAAGREITRLTTMDFFLGVFDPSTEDPVTTIESLEPILMETALKAEEADQCSDPIPVGAAGDAQDDLNISIDNAQLQSPQVSRSQQLSDFLGKASASLRLSLWHRLRTAYESIDYPAMVVLCNFRSMQIILRELQSSKHSKEAKEDRTANLLVWVRNLSDLLSHSLDIARNSSNGLECLEEQNLPLALRIAVEMIDMLHIFVLWEDGLRVGQYQAPQQPSGGANSYKSAMNHLRELQVKCWMLLYLLMKEMTTQHPKVYDTAAEDLAEYLAAVHNAFSHREYCRVGKKAFLKLMKKELISLNPPGDWSLDLAQIVFDLYGLKIYAKTSMLMDHGCNADQIDRTSALELIEPLMTQVREMNIKDVLRSEMKAATEKMQAVIGAPRSSTTNSAHQAFNRRLLLNYLKSPMIPVNLFQSLKGIGGLAVMPVTTDFATIAKKKWFFFQGHLLLARYLSQKKNTPGNTDDLDNAVNYFKLDLDFDAESWETWYRLGQTYDAKIDEDVTWDARELNNPASELVTYQKSSIHCYAMASAVAVRTADESPSTLAKMSELFSDFGNRVYASSRPPLDMKVFDSGELTRFFNQTDRGTWQQKPFTDMDHSAAWRFASELYRFALVNKPDSWWTWYMLGKCRWKLFKSEVLHRSGHKPKLYEWKNWYMNPRAEWQKDDVSKPLKHSFEGALDAFAKAVENVPQKRDSRHGDKDPVLEPHYKLVSVTYKLMQLGLIDLARGIEVLGTSPFMKKVAREDSDNARSYTLRALKTLCNADKSNWHHRMVVRTANVHYDADSLSEESAKAAKLELTHQIFTRTMAIQVWRPENERPGRHFVYKTGYTHFFTHLLHQLGDKADLDTLCKRIRRKQAEFLNHTWLWTEVATAYVRLLRAQGAIPTEHADKVFRASISYEAFAVNAGRLEAWAHAQGSAAENATLDLLREVVELRKLNGSYTPPTKIDELMDDVYARLYEQIVPGLAAKADEQENRERMRIDRMLFTDSPAPEDRSANEQGGGAAATSSRAKRIGRGEMRRRAEALVSNLGAPAAGARGGRRAPQSPITARGGFPPPRSGAGDDGDGEGARAAGGGSSAPGSVQDDADDESELSEPPADEDEDDGGAAGDVPRLKVPMFPGLARREGTAETGEEGTEDEHYETADEEGGEAKEGEKAEPEPAKENGQAAGGGGDGDVKMEEEGAQ